MEVFPDAKKIGQQLKFANRRGFRVALIAGEQEFEQETCQVKDLKTGESTEASLRNGALDVIKTIKDIVES